MSAWFMSKLDIDVLVQVALVGTLDDGSWTPLVADPDAFGDDLWQRNWWVTDGSWFEDDIDGAVANGDISARPAPYRFTPLPIGVTRAEAAKAIACYHYQTYVEEDDAESPFPPDPAYTRLDETPAGRVLVDLKSRMGEPDMDDGSPWGWKPEDVAARSDRPAPVIPD